MEMEKEKYQLSEGLEKFADRGCSAQTGKGECQITPCQKDWRSSLIDACQLRPVQKGLMQKFKGERSD